MYRNELRCASKHGTIVQMRVDRTKIGFIRPIKQRHSQERQHDALTKSGAQSFFTVGEDGVASWRDVARLTRRGDTVWVEALALLPDERIPRKRQPAVDLIEALDEFRDRGVVVIEASTGRRSDRKDELKAMRADAIKSLGAGGRSLPTAKARKNGGKGGRRPKVFSERDMERAEMVWGNLKKFPRWQDVRDALPKGFSTDRAFKLWGARGRLAKSSKR